MNKERKKALYESIMMDVAKIVKRRIMEADNESSVDNDRMYVSLDKDGKIRLISEDEVSNLMKGGTIRAYNPNVKAGPNEKDWTMYAVRVSDIKCAKCSFLGKNEGWPDYWTSSMTLWGKVSFIKGGHGQSWEPEFPGKLVIEWDQKKNCYTFTPYQFDGKYDQMSAYGDNGNYSHFVHRAVSVPYNSEEREIEGDKKIKYWVKHLSRGFRSYNAVKTLIKKGYLEVRDGELVPQEKK